MVIPSLSNRLMACSSFVKPGSRVADIGCDHGYLGIYLIKKGLADFVYAADINPAPLDSAKHNGQKYGTADKMSFHLSPGVKHVPQDFDTLVCAGMGADTIISILNDAPWLKSEKYHLILQCQSRRAELRKYLYEQGYCIISERLAQDGKFIYPIMEIVYCPSTPLTPGAYHISPALLNSKSPLLKPFYQRVLEGIHTTVQGLSHSGGEKLPYYQAVYKELLELEDQVNGNC